MPTAELKEKTYKDCAFFEAQKLDNSELKDLLKELYEIGNSDSPANSKTSKNMKRLFDLEDAQHYVWYDRFNNVSSAIKSEILYRIRTDKF